MDCSPPLPFFQTPIRFSIQGIWKRSPARGNSRLVERYFLLTLPNFYPQCFFFFNRLCVFQLMVPCYPFEWNVFFGELPSPSSMTHSPPRVHFFLLRFSLPSLRGMLVGGGAVSTRSTTCPSPGSVVAFFFIQIGLCFDYVRSTIPPSQAQRDTKPRPLPPFCLLSPFFSSRFYTPPSTAKRIDLWEA